MTIQEILEAHKVLAFSGSDTVCACDRTWRPDAEYRAHLAEVLEKHMQEREAAVIESLADELGDYRNSHDIAECAAPVEGETGRQGCIDRWIVVWML